MDVWLLRKVFVGGGTQQNRVTPSPFNFRLWTLDLDCDNTSNEVHTSQYNSATLLSLSWVLFQGIIVVIARQTLVE